MATNFKVWVESPNDASSGNVISPTDFNSSTERVNGYIPNTPVPSKMMNTILRETSLIITALMDQFCSSSTVTYLSTLANVKTALGNGIASKASVTEVANNLSSLSTTVSNITANNGPIAAVNTRVDNIVNGTTPVAKASSADIATNVGDITNDNTGSNAIIAFSIGTGANKKSYSKTITVPVPGTATQAEVVTNAIRIDNNDVAISSIFEVDGAVKNATHAETADSASYATSAGSASTATSATNATNATNATYANVAESANVCNEAQVASLAESTDFTNSTWTNKTIGQSATMSAGTYEIQVNDGETDLWCPFPIVTVAQNYSVKAYAFINSPDQYVIFNFQGGTGVVNTNSTWIYSSHWRYRKIR